MRVFFCVVFNAPMCCYCLICVFRCCQFLLCFAYVVFVLSHAVFIPPHCVVVLYVCLCVFRCVCVDTCRVCGVSLLSVLAVWCCVCCVVGVYVCVFVV